MIVRIMLTFDLLKCNIRYTHLMPRSTDTYDDAENYYRATEHVVCKPAPRLTKNDSPKSSATSLI